MPTIIKKTVKSSKKKKGTGSLFGIFEKIPVRLILITFVAGCLAAGVFFGTRYFFLNSGFFIVKEIVVKGDRANSFKEGKNMLRRRYLNENIFSVDLRKAQALVKKKSPHLKDVEIKRSLPDRIEVEITGRIPVAVIDSAGGVVIDRVGVIIAVREKPAELIEIKGVNFFFIRPVRGEKIENAMVKKALSLVKEINDNAWRVKDKFNYIDLSDKNNILIGAGGVQVKMGVDGFSRKIKELDRILRDPNTSLENIKYIDLRFEDPVISPR